MILNENVEGDRKGEFAFHRLKGLSVVDYEIANEEAMKIIRKFVVENRIEPSTYNSATKSTKY